VLLTEPWHGAVDIVGIGCAALGGACWGGYIVLTQRAGDRFTGIQSLSITTPIAAVTAAIVGIPRAVGHLSLGIIAAAAGLALLLSVLPFALEMLALRRLSASAFGTTGESLRSPGGRNVRRWRLEDQGILYEGGASRCSTVAGSDFTARSGSA
jgi:threonine/homoserine efflux transporter RhtA